MRSVVLVALLIASTLPLPGAAAKALTEDPSGDAQLSVFGLSGAAAPAGQGESVDLLSLEVLEDAEELTFVLKVTNLVQQVNFAEYDIFFSWGRTSFLVVAQRAVAPALIEDDTSAYIVNMDEDDRWDSFANLEHAFDYTAGTITIHLPKPYILSDEGKYPLLGDSLTDMYVEGRAHMTLFQFGATDAYDRMPDGEDTVSYDFLYGDIATGHLRMDAGERVRVSNGGATTFVYQVNIQNKGDFDDDVTLTLTDMPEGWNGTVQSPVLVPGGSERRVAILVSVPFAHDHGGFSSFNVTATSAEDEGSMASVRMGVLHTPIPQPAGHHADLYLHAKNFNGGLFGNLFPFTSPSMNTDGNHDSDVAEATPNDFGNGITWSIPLDPGLRMGLDFDLDRTGEIVGSIVGHSKGAGSLRGELLLVSPDGEEEVLLGDTDSVDVALDLSAPAAFKLAFTPYEEADYIPYLRGQNIRLDLIYESNEDLSSGCCIPGATPGLVVADFKATLPFNEYHDKLNGLSEAGNLLELKAEGAVEKTGLQGATMTYTFLLQNNGRDDATIDIDLAGTDAILGTLVPAGAVDIASKESRKITLAVQIPTDRNEGEEIEVLIFAHDQADPSKSAIARTKTIVGKQGAEDVVADETSVLQAAQAEEANDTPAPGVGALLALLAVSAFMLRRRSA